MYIHRWPERVSVDDIDQENIFEKKKKKEEGQEKEEEYETGKRRKGERIGSGGRRSYTLLGRASARIRYTYRIPQQRILDTTRSEGGRGGWIEARRDSVGAHTRMEAPGLPAKKIPEVNRRQRVRRAERSDGGWGSILSLYIVRLVMQVAKVGGSTSFNYTSLVYRSICLPIDTRQLSVSSKDKRQPIALPGLSCIRSAETSAENWVFWHVAPYAC
ncbi:hypothetical protein B0H11DRAFT_2424661 [Mycena galericulata]|nr:hypothetical protein B0H11DRAFT_2424661 [Mycena galericulata]